MMEWLLKETPTPNWILIIVVIICWLIYIFCISYITKSLIANRKSKMPSFPNFITNKYSDDGTYNQTNPNPRTANAKPLQYQNRENDNSKPNNYSNNNLGTHIKRIIKGGKH